MPDPWQRAIVALEGLSVGDAFGERFFAPALSGALAAGRRIVPEPPWRWTDDTAMALGVVEVLRGHGTVDPDELARVFARRYAADPHRGYGAGAHEILGAIGAGRPWAEAAGEVFDGAGSMGNGAAMRVAPVGAWFCGSLAKTAEQALRSACPTHAHPEGQAGAVAVAVAVAAVCEGADGAGMLAAARDLVREGPTRAGIAKAIALGPDVGVHNAVRELGNGARITAPDTIPFVLWCAARHLDDYAEALWTTVAGLGDIDTNAAIVGGIVAGRVGVEGIPTAWRGAREPI